MLDTNNELDLALSAAGISNPHAGHVAAGVLDGVIASPLPTRREEPPTLRTPGGARVVRVLAYQFTRSRGAPGGAWMGTVVIQYRGIGFDVKTFPADSFQVDCGTAHEYLAKYAQVVIDGGRLVRAG